MSALNIDFTQLAANGSTAASNIPIDGLYAFYAYGAFGGGTITFQSSLDGGTTWFTLSTLTANGRTAHSLTNNEIVRATLSAATTPTVDVGIR